MAQNQLNGKNLVINRIFEAPRERVWILWTDPDQLSCWMGPREFTAPYTGMDFRIGGRYLYCMRGPDGKDYWSTGVFKDIREPGYILYSDSFADEHGNVVSATFYGGDPGFPLEVEVEVTFDELDGKTRLHLEHRGLPEGELIGLLKAGWEESFDKLAECLG